MSNDRCPHCGAALQVRITTTTSQVTPFVTGNQSQMGLMQSNHPWQSSHRLDSAAAAGAHMSASRKTPSRPPSVGADVLTPALKGVTVGVAAACLAIIPTVAVPSWPWYSPFVVLAIVGPVAVIGFVFHHQGHLWVYEQVTQEPPELPELPAPPSPDVVASYRDLDGDKPTQKRFTLPAGVDDEKFYTFLVGILAGGKTLARSDWVGKGKPLSRGQHTQLINELARLHAIRLVDPDKPTMGYELTRMGKVLFSGWLESLKSRQLGWE